VYGNDTMAAVAEYQRRNELPVTGAVDLPTARALGVVEDPATAGPAADEVTDEVTDAVAAPAPAASPVVAVADVEEGSSGVDWRLVVGGLLAMTVVAVVARRRYVVARRAAHRRRRVHPSTSPRRSVADLRRSGALERDDVDVGA
jgi:hypothetical protein